MNVEKILAEIGISQFSTYTKVEGGRDSLVWKIVVDHDRRYALRVLPRERFGQFIREHKMLQMAFNNSIHVPKVHVIKQLAYCSVMLMDWVSGHMVFTALQEHPALVEKLGYEFGKTHALLHRNQHADVDMGDWFTPGTPEEEDLYNEITEQIELKHNLIHLDYHPLNVLTDRNQITGVIDWVNASFGDYRFDVARTLSILRLAVPKLSQDIDLTMVKKFERAYVLGYESKGNALENMALFNEWAELRTIRDLQGFFEEEV